MKHLKRFNEELKDMTYISAIRKLKASGREKQALNINNWVDEKDKIKVINKWKKNIDTLKEFGSFYMKISIPRLRESAKNIEGNFYLYIDFDDLAFEDSNEYDRGQSENYESSFYLTIGLVPVDEETKELCDKNLPDPEFGNGFYWSNSIDISFEVVNDRVNILDVLLQSYDLGVSGHSKFGNRQSANKFKNLLTSIFNNKVNYPVDRTDSIKNLYDLLESSILNKCRFSGDYGFSLDEVSNFIRSKHVTSFPGFVE